MLVFQKQANFFHEFSRGIQMAIKNDLKLKKIWQIDYLYTYILTWKQNVTNPLELNVFTASVDF